MSRAKIQQPTQKPKTDSRVAAIPISTTNPAQVNMLTVDSGFYYYTVSAGVPGTGVYNLSSAVIAVPVSPPTRTISLSGEI